MSEQGESAKLASRWVRDLLVIPLIVGVVITALAFGLPRLFEKSKELSYEIVPPTRYFFDPSVGRLTIKIDDEEVSNLVTHTIRIWNSGDVPLKQIAIRCVFEGMHVQYSAPGRKFRIVSVGHRTIPELEFGNIEEERINRYTRRFIFELLNPGDEDTLTFHVDDPLALAELTVFAKAEGLTVRAMEFSDESWMQRNKPIFFGLLGMLGGLMSLLASGLSRSTEKKNDC